MNFEDKNSRGSMSRINYNLSYRFCQYQYVIVLFVAEQDRRFRFEVKGQPAAIQLSDIHLH